MKIKGFFSKLKDFSSKLKSFGRNEDIIKRLIEFFIEGNLRIKGMPSLDKLVVEEGTKTYSSSKPLNPYSI